MTAKDLSNLRVEVPVELDSLKKPIYVGSVGFVGDMNSVLFLSAMQSVIMKATARITEVNEVGLEIISDVSGEPCYFLNARGRDVCFFSVSKACQEPFSWPFLDMIWPLSSPASTNNEIQLGRSLS